MRPFHFGPILALLLASCAPRANRIVVGAGTSTEQRILGEVMAQQIERRTTVPVERRFGLDGALACHRAQGSGKIDVYPEYTVTALVDILRHRPAEASAALSLVAREFPDQFRAAWLPPFGLENRVAPVIREVALQRHPEVRTALSELGGAIGDSTLHRLVGLVDTQHRAVADVAHEFLAGLPR